MTEKQTNSKIFPGELELEINNIKNKIPNN